MGSTRRVEGERLSAAIMTRATGQEGRRRALIPRSSLPEVGLAVAAATFLVALSPVPAVAALSNCSVAQRIFVKSTNIDLSTHGVTNKLLVSSRTLDNTCKAGAFSTAHLRKTNFGATLGTWIEVGWQKLRNADGTTVLCEFWEMGTNSNIDSFHNNCGNQTPLSFGNYAQFRLKEVANTNQWDVLINYLDGTGYQLKHTFSTDYLFSTASGETEKKGAGTGMGDDQRNLQVFAQNAWQDWIDVACVVDESPDWSWHKQSNNSYTVTGVNNAC